MTTQQLLEWVQNVLQPYFSNQWAISGIIFGFFIFLSLVVLFVYNRYLNQLAKKTKSQWDDMLYSHTKKPLFYFILVYGLKISILSLGAGEIVTGIVNSLMAVVFVLIVLRTIDVFIETWGLTIAKRTKTNIDDVLLPLFHKIANVAFIIIALMWILSIWEIDLTPYLAGVGISGLVLGLALQDSLKNVFGGITLILDKTFQQGDKIQLESGEVGKIYDIGLRSTKLVTFNNEIIYIPNGYLANSRIQNFTRPSPKVRIVIPFNVEYGSDIKKVQKVVLKELHGMKNNLKIMKDPEPVVEFVNMAESGLSFNAKFWVEKWDEAHAPKLEATERIYNALNKAKIGIPFPTRTVYMKNIK